MGRTSTARDRLLDATAGLMRHRGYTGVGIAEICASADVKKGSFYHFFDSKQALTLEVVSMHWHCQRTLWATELSGNKPALTRLRNLLASMVSVQERTKDDTGTVDGCLLGNLALELSAQEPMLRAHLEEIFEEQTALIAGVIKEAAAEGSVDHRSATSTTARAVVAHIEGMILFAKLKNDPSVLNDLWPHTLLLLGADGA
ncbi:TetR/AcrR family transcriptional regulator [Streptomyces sp. NPDC015127]|uniref:TetR/AcrR family transcriptional regulator n=1 Tax=Streptomyces sp. NPDC015127 TaxID=3364939 RepID=UPI0036FB3DC0